MAPPKQTQTPTSSKPAATEDLEVLPFVSLKKLGKDKFVVIKVQTKGRVIVEEEILTEGPVPRAHAEDRLRVAVSELFLDPRTSVV